MKISSLNTILYCRHWKETVQFYQEVMQFEVLFSTKWFVEFGVNDSARLSIADEKRASVKSSHGRGITISLKVDDSDRLQKEMRVAGLSPSSMKTIWSSRVFYLYDPEGNRIEFWSV